MIHITELFKRNKDHRLFSVVDGVSFPIEEVKDEVFSKKLLGDGIAIKPTGSSVSAPCDGELSVLFPTGHAFGVKSADGLEYLVHIGLDTVTLGGQGFRKCKRQGDKVKRGDVIVELDLPYLQQSGYDLTVLVIIVDDNHRPYTKMHYGQVKRNESVMLSISRT